MSRTQSHLGGPAEWLRRAVVVLGIAVPTLVLAQATPRLPTPLPVPKTAPKAAEPAKTAPAAPAPKAAAEPATGERDPFEPLVQPGEGEAGIKQVTSLKLVGIVWDAGDRKQIRALVETPDGLGYYLRVSEERFGGKVIGIEQDRVKFSVREQDPSGQSRVRTVELKLRSE